MVPTYTSARTRCPPRPSGRGGRNRAPCWCRRQPAHRRGDTTSYGLRARVLLRRRAGADQVPVAVGAIDPVHRRPHLPLAGLRAREGGLFAGVGAVPRVTRHLDEGVGRVLEDVPFL